VFQAKVPAEFKSYSFIKIKEDITEDKKALSDEELEGVSGGITGHVSFFDEATGAGRLVDNKARTVVVYAKDVPGGSLKAGQWLSYDIVMDDCGPMKAANIKII